MNLVLRNPLVRLVRSYGWAVLLAAVSLAIVLGGFHALTAAGAAAALLAGFAGGLVGAGALRARRSREAVEAERREKGLSFVCPQCLIAAMPTRACPGCRRPLPVDVIATQGTVVRFCEQCREEVSAPALDAAPACCSACGLEGEGSAWLEQTCAVLGALSEADFATLAAAAGGTVQTDRGLRYIRCRSGEAGLFVYCLADLANSRAELPPNHALASLGKIWVHEVDALAGTEALDRLAQRARLSRSAMARIELYAAGPSLDPAAGRAFAVRLAAPRLGVAAPEFLRRAAGAAAVSAGEEVPR